MVPPILAACCFFLAAGALDQVAASPSGKILIIGGMLRSNITEVWTPDASTPSLLRTSQRRWGHTATQLLDGRVLVCGGWGDKGKRLSSCELLDPETLASSPAASLPVPLDGHAAAALGDAVFVCGGERDSRNMLSSCFRYRRDSWTPVANMLNNRDRFGFASNGRSLYACGGYNATHSIVACEQYDPESDKWTPLPPLPGGARRDFGAVFGDDGRFYAVGGYKWPFDHEVSRVDIFDPASGTWAQGPPLTTPRHAHSVVKLGGAIWAVGGWDAADKTAEVLEPGSNKWRLADKALLTNTSFSAAVAISPHAISVSTRFNPGLVMICFQTAYLFQSVM